MDWDRAFGGLRGSSGADLAPEQADAVKLALTGKVAVLTGGPGCGKSFTVRSVVELAHARNAKVVLAAPTGRAAKRLTELTGHDAATIHRLLQLRPGGEPAYDADNPLDADLIVVDETSMVDVILANKLVKAVPPGAHLLLVGDVDQLPSVGAGEVLRDLIAAGTLPVVRLTKIFRQAQQTLGIVATTTRRGSAQRHRRNHHRHVARGPHADRAHRRGRDGKLRLRRVLSRARARLRCHHPPLPGQRVPGCCHPADHQLVDDAPARPARHRRHPREEASRPGRPSPRPRRRDPHQGLRPPSHRPGMPYDAIISAMPLTGRSSPAADDVPTAPKRARRRCLRQTIQQPCRDAGRRPRLSGCLNFYHHDLASWSFEDEVHFRACPVAQVVDVESVIGDGPELHQFGSSAALSPSLLCSTPVAGSATGSAGTQSSTGVNR